MPVFTRRLLVVDDDRLLASSMSRALSSEGFDARHAGSAAEAKKLLRSFDPDAILVDIDLGDGPSGIDLVHVVRRLHPEMVTILLTKHPDSYAAGYKAKDIPEGVAYLRKSHVHDTTALIDAINQAARGQWDSLRHDKQPSGKLECLTPTQREILHLMALGLSNQEIAKRRSVSVSSVEQRISSINKALGIVPDGSVHPRTQAIREYMSVVGIPVS